MLTKDNLIRFKQEEEEVGTEGEEEASVSKKTKIRIFYWPR
jgi:hypothetical protein